VVIIAAPQQVYPKRWQTILWRYPALQALTWDLEMPDKRLATFLKQEGIPYVDLLPAFREATIRHDAPNLHLKHDGHWTVEGYALAAELIYQFLLDNHLLRVESATR
jgi:hypothetical protein